MKTTVFLLAAILLISGTALARDGRKVDGDTPTLVAGRVACVTAGYDYYHWDTGTAIPDDNPVGVLIGPLATTPGSVVLDVILYVNMTHTYIGDLIIGLQYDADCDGIPETFGGVLCRQGMDGCPTGGCCGCGGDLLGWYGFDDTVESIEDACQGPFAPGCYGPDYDSAGLDVFDGLTTGGCFWLYVVDGAEFDTGVILEWEVYVLAEPATQDYGAFDIKPTSCPNPLNVNSQGVLPAAILGTEVFDVTQIDPETIMLACTVEPLRYDYEDVATPVGPDAEPCECTEEGPDGYLDLTMKFEMQDVVTAMGAVNDGDEVSLVVTATLLDGTVIALYDCVWIIDNAKELKVTALDAPLDSNASKETAEQVTWGNIKALYR